MNLKRLWDTENQKIIWAVNKSDHKKVYQVRTNNDGSKLYIYKDKREELDQTTEDVKEYGPVWKTLADETVGYYLTSEPTELFNRDEGDEASYQFVNRDGTVLQSGKVDEGETPEYTGETPTREATAQYTYTFAGWNPTVGPISKKTIYTATYTATVNKYTVSASSEDINIGTVSPASVANVEYGTAITVADNVVTIGTGESASTITATAETGYVFSSWGEVPATVTGATSITATFEAEPDPETPGE